MIIQFKDLERDPWHRELIKILEEKFGKPLPENLQKFLVDTTYWSEVIPKQVV